MNKITKKSIISLFITLIMIFNLLPFSAINLYAKSEEYSAQIDDIDLGIANVGYNKEDYVGYASITNYGTLPFQLSSAYTYIEISGMGASNFECGWNNGGGTIQPGQSDGSKAYIKPKAGLDVGNYRATVYLYSSDEAGEYTYLDSGTITFTVTDKEIHTVTFDTQGGTMIAPSTQQVIDGERMSYNSLTRSPTIGNGWNFLRWFNNPSENTDFTESFDFSTKITSDITLTAVYKGMLRLDTNDITMGEIGFALPTEELSYETQDSFRNYYIIKKYRDKVKIGARAKDGYEFVKWTRGGEDYSTEAELEITVDSGDMNLWAVFRPHEHNLNLVSAVDETCTTPGHTAYYTCSKCDNWFEDAGGNNVISDHSTVVIPAKGHSAGTPVEENKVLPTYEEYGSYDEVTYCTDCGAELGRVHKKIAKLINIEEPTFNITYDFNGGNRHGESTYVTTSVAFAPDITVVAFIDLMEVTAPTGKELDAIEINGVRYELGSSYMLNQDTTYKYIWKDISKPHSHTYKTIITKAKLNNNGSIIEKCTECGDIKSNTVIAYPKEIKLSKTTFTYNNKVQKPTIKVIGSDGKEISSNNYTISYSNKNSKKVGEYSVTITFKGNYEGTKKLTYKITPKGTSISKLTAAKKKFTAAWKKQTTETTGYEIQYSTDKNFSSGNKTVGISKNKTTSKAISKLKAKKKYYVRIRTYKKVNVKKIYSSWSSSKSVKTKK